MSDDWHLQCPAPDPSWELTPEQEVVYWKLQAKIANWCKQPKNDVPTVSCEDGKFRPEVRYG